jgi:hypothetical protein
MTPPSRFILTCKCGHLYEYFSRDTELMEMDFKPIRDLPRESQEGDLERILARLPPNEKAAPKSRFCWVLEVSNQMNDRENSKNYDLQV